jgi:opacity protein-like surface antigen
MKARISLLAAAAILVTALPSLAQNRPVVELNPFGGYLFGGTFDRGSNAIFDTKVDVDDHATYGGRIGFLVTRSIEVELQYSRTETHFVTHDHGDLFGPGDERLGDLDIDYYLAYGTFHFGHNPRIRPYVSIGAGAARLDPHVPNFSSHAENKFTASLGVGIKTMFNPHFGLRLDGRYYTTRLNNNDDNHRHDNCNDFWDNCSDRNWLTNGDVTGGLVIAF